MRSAIGAAGITFIPDEQGWRQREVEGERLYVMVSAAEVRSRPVMLESQRFLACRSDPTASLRTPRRVYAVTREGRQTAGNVDALSPR